MLSNSFKSSSLALVMFMVSVLAFPVFGQNKTHSVNISREAKLSGQVLSPGKYKIAFDEKNDGEAIVSRNGQEVKASYKLVELGKSPSDSAVVFVADTDGSLKVRRIEIKGRKMAIEFE